MQSRLGVVRSRRFTALFERYLFTHVRSSKSAPQTQTLLTDSRQNASKENLAHASGGGQLLAKWGVHFEVQESGTSQLLHQIGLVIVGPSEPPSLNWVESGV